MLNKDTTLVVLPYVQRFAQGHEIEIALSGWKRFCEFEYEFVVIGEFSEYLRSKFPWITFIEYPTTPRIDNQYTPHIDVQHKMETIKDLYSDRYVGFIRMMDDIYAIKSFSLSDIVTTHYHSSSFKGNPNAPTSFWNYDKYKTRQLLDKESLPHCNYATHFPSYFEFKKLEEIWDKYNMREESYVYEDIYFNYFHHDEPVLDSAVRLGIWNRDILKNDFKNAIDNPAIKFMCNSVNGWSAELEEFLQTFLEKESI